MWTMQHPPDSPAADAGPAPHDATASTWRAQAPSALKRLHSDALLGGAREVEIEHQGAVYRLKITSLGKLILTK